MDNSMDEAMMNVQFDSDPPDTGSARDAAIMKSIEHRGSLDEQNEKMLWNETDDSTIDMQTIEQAFIDGSCDTLCGEHYEISKSIERCEPKAEEKRFVLKRSDLRCLKTCFGEDVANYLKKSNIVEKKSVSNMYVLSNNEGFEECNRLFKDHCEKEDEPIEKVAKITNKKPPPLRQKNCYDSPVAFVPAVNDYIVKTRSKIDNIEEKSVCETLGVATNLSVSFEKSYGTTETIKCLSIFRHRKRGFTCEWDYKNMFKLMMETEIGCEQMIDYASCFNELKPILTEFHRRHEKFEYHYELQHIMNIKKLGQLQNVQSVTLHQFQKYFSRTFFEVIPLSLFGKHRNVKKARKALKQYFLVAYDDNISLTSCVNSFDISCITWLRPIRDEATRWSVIAKVTKWIFEKYLCAVLKAVFSVQKALHNEQKVFMCAADWAMSKRRYIRREEKIGSIKKIGLNSRLPVMYTVPSGAMKLFPKGTGIRPIIVIRYACNIREEVELLRTLLQQCYLERHGHPGLSNLHAAWRSQSTRTKRRKNNQLYFVKCDVTEAYGSIIQTKLFDIINAMINEIPGEKLRAQWFKIIRRPRWEGDGGGSIDHKCWFTCCPELPYVKSRALVRPFRDAHHLPGYIEKAMVINWFKDYIFNQSFQFNNARYIQAQGVAQGSPLSPILAEIYYSHMKVQEFRSFVKSGNLIRFVDDFLYVTKDEAQAKRFLEAIGEGVSQYNCRFQASKTQTNVRSTLYRRSETIVVLGYRLNTTTLEVQPHFDFRSCRYSTKLRTVSGGNSIKLSPGRLVNKYVLKMNTLVLSPKINSVNVLVENAGLIARMMSLRCAFFISTIFDDISKFSKSIMKTICVAVEKIASEFQHRLPLYDRQVRIPIMRRIRIAIWASFLRVFSKNIEMRKCFCNKIKRKIGQLNAY